MTAKLIDGAAVARAVRAQVAQRCAEYVSRHGSPPGLAVLLVGDDPASAVYVRHKVTDSEEAGLRSMLERHPATLTEADLLARVHALNADPRVHGILVQLPLPAQIDPQRVIEAIDPAKDVDGFHVANAGALLVGRPGFLPCTPYGCMKLIDSLEPSGRPANLRGKHAVVIGRSNTVGKPMALLLLQRDATVTICHSGTPDLAAQVAQADLVVAAVGRQNLVTADMVKPGAIVLDVGMNRDAQGRLCGDVDFAAVREVAGHITPVPGGVGPMTRAMLLSNTLDAAERLAAAT
ncbi:MAG: bifunctional methylenetetrahydrofolate dehydrogenase/methenyltetrahydrofolate cyclohydrolase [Burkholderiaceae bacterium]